MKHAAEERVSSAAATEHVQVRLCQGRAQAARICARLTGMTKELRAEVVDQLRRVIAWEMDAQTSVGRPIEDMPPLVADSVLDYFDVALKPGADLSGPG